MQKKLNCVLLIDDDDSTNFLHKLILQKSEISETIKVVNSAEKGLEYLNSNDENTPRPDIIFLDLNMPRMNGWEFVEEYKKLENDIYNKYNIYDQF